jgi:tryptophan synthase alpha chain
MSGISDVFERQSGGAVITYLMGGDPTEKVSLQAVGAAVRGGADMVELGIPFSDPIADGRTIQGAGLRALSSGTTPRVVFRIAKEAKRLWGVPVIIMTYLNPIVAMGVDGFLDAAGRSGVDGLIVPDMPAEEALDFARAAKEHKIDPIMLAAPTTTEARMRLIARNASGFLYLVSLMGVTGARARLDTLVPGLVARARRSVGDALPLAVGFGISAPEHVKQVIRSGADAAIVGSALVERVERNLGDAVAMTREVERYVRSLKLAATYLDRVGALR